MLSALILVVSHLIITCVLKNYLLFKPTVFFGDTDVGTNVMFANDNIVATSFKYWPNVMESNRQVHSPGDTYKKYIHLLIS